MEHQEHMRAVRRYTRQLREIRLLIQTRKKRSPWDEFKRKFKGLF